MIREVDLVSYLPPFIADYKETSAALTTENPEFVLIWKAAERALYNEFIGTASEGNQPLPGRFPPFLKCQNTVKHPTC